MIYVVTWLSEGRFGLVKAFRTQSAAAQFLQLMEAHGDPSKKYAIAEVEFAKE